MPRDPRPFVTYPLNYTGHPRIESLSDGAFRAFHEMNDYSRVHGLDGDIPIAVARKRWPSKVLVELTTGIDDRPLVYLGLDAYVIRSYSEHQFTTADADALRTARAEAGRKGGEAKARARQAAGNGVASASRDGKQILPESESESESEDLTTKTSERQSSGERASVPTDAVEVPEMTKRLASQAGITSLQAVVEAARKHTGRDIDGIGAFQLASHILAKAPRPPRNPQMYVTRSISLSPFEVQQFIDEQGLAVAS